MTGSYTLGGTLAGSDAISGVTYTYLGTGTTVYASSTTPPAQGGTYSVTPSAVVFSTGSVDNYTIDYEIGSVTIGRASQSITFTQPADVTYLVAPFSIEPTASSSLAVNVTASPARVCTISGFVVTIAGAGDCTLTATQAGDRNFVAATSVARTFTVNPADQQTLSITSPSTAIFGQTITLAASGGSGTGSLASGVTSGTCTVSGTTLTLGDAGSDCRVRATKVSDANYNLAQSAIQTITISQAGQTLAFTSSVPTSPLPNGTYVPAASAI